MEMMNKGMSGKAAITVKTVDVFGSTMSYMEAGAGKPVLFLHGIPMSNYVWRNIIPYLSPLGRCIAPDLIGFGKSDKPDIAYSIEDHIRYIEKFIEVTGLKNLVLVMHGWGSIIGLDYAMRHEKNCRGLVLYEAFMRSFNVEDASLPFQEQIHALEDMSKAYDLVTSGTVFIDKIIPQNTMRQLSEEEMDEYRQPFAANGSGKPILQYVNDLSKNDGQDKLNKLIAAYSRKLAKSRLPKLLLYSVPGLVTNIATVKWAKEHLPNLEVIDIGEEMHLGQESNPALMGDSISAWLQAIEG